MNIKENLIERTVIKQKCFSDEKNQLEAIELCKKNILHFFNFFLWTFDPRGQIKDLPFIPWAYQEKYIIELNDDIKNGISSLTEKSRDMGVTWMVLGTFLYRWLILDDSFLLGSRKEELVDTLGEMDTHFERLRYMISKLPSWMLKLCGFNSENSSYMKIYKDNGASLTGESMNKDFSRQGRYKAILLDELAFCDGAEQVWRSCGDSAPCKLPVSTPNGRHNFFADLRNSGKIKVHTLHWRMHPNKNENWYIAEKEKRSTKDVAQELDINYTVSAGNPFYIGFSRPLNVRRMTANPGKDLVLGFDYGFNHSDCVITQLMPEGYFLVADNIFGTEQTIEEFGEYCKNYLTENFAGYNWGLRCYGDPAGKQASDKGRKSSEATLREIGFKVVSIPSNTSKTNYAARKKIIEKLLRTLINGIPQFVVADVPGNQIIIEGLEGGYRYPDANRYGGVAERPVEDDFFEHAINSLEYVILNLFKAIEPRAYVPDGKKYLNRILKFERIENAGIGYGK